MSKVHTSSKKKILNTISVVIIFSLVVFLSALLLDCSRNIAKSSELQENIIKTGRYLFYDRRLSVNNTRSCGTCHNPTFAFTDGYKRSLGVFADLHQRNTEPLFNLSYLKYFTAADSSIHSLLQQMNNPLFNNHPAEMGVKGNEALILNRIASDKDYINMFALAGMDITWINIKIAISSFISTIRSANSGYDKFINGDSAVFNDHKKNGMALFFSSRLKCASCHGGFNFSTPSLIGENRDTIFFFNTGLYDIDGKGSYPPYDQGLYKLTGDINDMGKFRVPTLRNLAFTAPYFHDGSAATINDVIDIYINGGRKIGEGIYNGDGSKNRYKHPFINGFSISETEKHFLIDFLFSLSDSSFINEESIQNPFTGDETKNKY